jgi:TRAP transporter TAXI family solute receptor
MPRARGRPVAEVDMVPIRTMMAPVRAFLAITVISAGLWSGAFAADPTVLRLGTGGAGGTYYPVGTIIAQGLSDAGESQRCPGPGGCGVAGVLAVAQVSNGSVANLEGLRSGSIELGIAQSNIVDWAFSGRVRFKDRGPAHELRAIANLYPETVHIVVRANAGMSSVKDLRGRRVSLDESGSGTLEDAREILRTFGLAESDLIAEYVKPDLAAQRMVDGRLDGFFIVAGAPVAAVANAASKLGLTLLPVSGPAADQMLQRLPFYSRAAIPAGTYPGVPHTETIAVGAQLIGRADLDERLAYEVARALWSERTRRLLDAGHPKAREIRRENALQGISIPLHAGAQRFYREAGMLVQ